MSDEKRFTLRIDPELFEIIKKQAEKNRRSIAKEIEFILLSECQKLDSHNDEKK